MRIKKFLSLLLILTILFTNYSFVSAASIIKYSRDGGDNLTPIAKEITDDYYLNGIYNAETIYVAANNVEIYKYGSTTEKLQSAGTITDYADATTSFAQNQKYYLLFAAENTRVNYVIALPEGETTLENVATIVYYGGLKYNGNTYNVRMDIDKICKIGDTKVQLGIRKGATPNDVNGGTDLTKYTTGGSPQLAQRGLDANSKMETYLKYSIIDNSGNPVSVSGVWGFTDVDGSDTSGESWILKDFVAQHFNINTNTFMTSESKNNSVVSANFKYKIVDNNSATQIYSTAATDSLESVYFKIDNKSSLSVVRHVEGKVNATSALRFLPNVIKRYNNVFTEVLGGTINPTPAVTNIQNGANQTVTYSPADASKQYLKSITVDGSSVSTAQYPNNYTFQNIQSDHRIRVEYANKYIVTFDAKGGTPTPDKQYVNPNGLAALPSTSPTKAGYTFDGWQLKGQTTKYNFSTPVTSNITLEARWTPNPYTITYYGLEGSSFAQTNPNPGTYTIESNDIVFQYPTKTGYTFKGWYSDSTYSTPITGVPKGSTGNKNAYAKWEEAANPTYKVEHYVKGANGQYPTTATYTDQKNDKRIGETATATARTIAGYEVDTAANNVMSGSVPATGTLTLKIYYKPVNYKITYEPNGGVNSPENPPTYTVNENITLKDPTREGYVFKGWYEDANYTNKIEVIEGSRKENIKVYAKWEAKPNPTYKVEHYLKGTDGKYPTTPTHIDQKNDKKVGETANATARTIPGYEVDTAADNVMSGSVPATGTLTLKIYYKPVNYKITYEPNGGVNSPENPPTYTVNENITLKDPTREGYVFKGWYEDANYTNKIEVIEGSRKENIKVYAKWEASKTTEYNVEYYLENSNGEYELKLTVPCTGTTDETANAEILEFGGYKENTTHKNRNVSGTIKGDGSLVLRVYYDRIRHTVSFDPQNGEKIDDQIVPNGEKVEEPDKPTNEGYVFDHWYYTNENGEQVVYDFDTPVTSDIKLIAKWDIAIPEGNNNDNTVAPTIIPQTGDFNPAIAFSIMAMVTLAGVFGIKYFIYKRTIK